MNDKTSASADALALFPHEPSVRWTLDALNKLLAWIVEHKASDIKLNPGQPIYAKRGKRWIRITQRALNGGEIAELLDATSRNTSTSSRVMSGDDKDYGHEIALDRFKRLRFRVNATACADAWVSSSEVTFRAIPGLPPTLDALGIEQDLVDAVVEQPGLVLVAGETGSGKSTLLAAILRHINEHYPWSIATYEDPIEYRLTNLPNTQGPVAQSQIGVHFDSFARAPRNSLRRNEDVILVGETRDRETVTSLLAFAETGPLCFSTIHTNSVAETPGRIIRMYPGEDQNNIAAYLVQALRMIVYQQLVETPDPTAGQGTGVVALREYVTIDDVMRRRLESSPPTQYRHLLEAAMREGNGKSLDEHAQERFSAGEISEQTLQFVKRIRAYGQTGQAQANHVA